MILPLNVIFENAHPVSFPHSVLESEVADLLGIETVPYFCTSAFYLVVLPDFLSGRHSGVKRKPSCARASAGCPQGLRSMLSSDAQLARCVLGLFFTFFWLLKDRPGRVDTYLVSHSLTPHVKTLVRFGSIRGKNYSPGHSAETREASWFSLRIGTWITYKECVVLPYLWLQVFGFWLPFLLVVSQHAGSLVDWWMNCFIITKFSTERAVVKFNGQQ